MIPLPRGNDHRIDVFGAGPLGGRLGTGDHDRHDTKHDNRSRSRPERLVDLPPIGFSAGDTFLFRERLLDDEGVAVGFDQVTCTIHIPSVLDESTGQFRVSQLCEGTISLTDGTVEVSGTTSFIGRENLERAAAPFRIAQRERTQGIHIGVTGGSGAYQNARGELEVGRGNILTLHLIP